MCLGLQTKTKQPPEKPLDPRNNHENKFEPTKFPGEKSLHSWNTHKGMVVQTHQTHEIWFTL